MPHITQHEIGQGLHELGLNRHSNVIVHSSLRSFGHVEGGAHTVCAALSDTCGTILLPAASWDLTGVPAPPGLERPLNAPHRSESWAEFNQALSDAKPFAIDLPIDRELGIIPETMRCHFPHHRSRHPLFSYLATGNRAVELIDSQTMQDPLAPLATLEGWDGQVLLIGVDHTTNTAIHLAEQRLHRSCFWRYAKIAEGVWAEYPNIPGESDAFNSIEPALAPFTRETRIGASRVRLVSVADVLRVATEMIEADPSALLAAHPDPESRTAAALKQRLTAIDAAATPNTRGVEGR